MDETSEHFCFQLAFHVARNMKDGINKFVILGRWLRRVGDLWKSAKCNSALKLPTS